MNVLPPPCLDFSVLPSRWFVCVLSTQVNRGQVGGRAWLFVGQCWLAASEGDGRVERMLRVCTQGIGFAKVEHSHAHMRKKNMFNSCSHVSPWVSTCMLADVVSQAI